jgi:uncharacterized protein YggE
MKHLKLIHTFFLLCCLCSPAIAQEDKVIKVSGTGIVSSKPDRARIYMRVSSVDKSIVAAKKTVDEKVGRVQQMLLDFGVRPNDINTSGLSVYEERVEPFNRDAARLEGYRVNRDIVSQVEDISKLDAILDNALNLGANSIQNIQFHASNIEGLKLAAMEKASDDAHKKAEFLARKFGRKLGPAQQIEYDYKGPGPQPYGVLAVGARSAEASFLPGTIEITATVNVVYQIQ